MSNYDLAIVDCGGRDGTALFFLRTRSGEEVSCRKGTNMGWGTPDLDDLGGDDDEAVDASEPVLELGLGEAKEGYDDVDDAFVE